MPNRQDARLKRVAAKLNNFATLVSLATDDVAKARQATAAAEERLKS